VREVTLDEEKNDAPGRLVFVLYRTVMVKMSSRTFSVIVRCWYDNQADATQLRVVRTDTAKEVRLSDSSFLLRFSVDEAMPVGRCFIRHLASGREAYVQGGQSLHAFIKDCLLNGSELEHDDTGRTGEDEATTEK
jgi:hypothetical protein